MPAELLGLIKKEYPEGYEDNLITFQTPTGELATGLPLETEDTYYLIRMPKAAVASNDDEEESDEGASGDNFENLDALQIAEDDEESDDD